MPTSCIAVNVFNLTKEYSQLFHRVEITVVSSIFSTGTSETSELMFCFLSYISKILSIQDLLIKLLMALESFCCDITAIILSTYSETGYCKLPPLLL